MNKEFDSLEEIGVFKLVDSKPPGRKLMSMKYVFAIKTDEKNYVKRFKVRMVARGFTQIQGVEYFDTYSAVVAAETNSNYKFY